MKSKGSGRHWLSLIGVVVAIWAASGTPVVTGGQPTVAAPAQVGGDGFEPVSALPPAGQEQLPAAPLVMTAYGFVWLMLLGYVWFIWRRLGQVERELEAVARRVDEQQRR